MAGEIRNLSDALEIALERWETWFRGQSQVFPTLKPKAYRSAEPQRVLEKRENVSYDYFKTVAPSLQGGLPDEGNHLEWLLWMQHHGGPTRLLDWTANVFVALYFAVTENQKEDAQLWALDPRALNRHVGMRSVASGDDAPVVLLAAEVVGAWETGCPQDRWPVAFMPRMRFPRMFAQRSVFTIHPAPSRGRTLEDPTIGAEVLREYRIPAGRKADLHRDLVRMGVTQDALFPGLDGVGRASHAEVFIIGPTTWLNNDGEP